MITTKLEKNISFGKDLPPTMKKALPHFVCRFALSLNPNVDTNLRRKIAAEARPKTYPIKKIHQTETSKNLSNKRFEV